MMRTANRLAMIVCAGMVTACGGSKTVVDSDQRGEAGRLNMQLGVDYYRQGNLPQAKEKLERSVEQDPRNATTHTPLGLLYDRLGDVDKAEHHFDRAVSLDPKNPEIHNNFAVFLCRHGKYARGEKEALAAVADPLYTSPEAALLNAGQCARSGGNIELAEKHFRRALAVKPRFGAGLLEMADVELRQKNYLSARAFLERYSVVEKPGPTALWLGVRIETALGNRALAGDYARNLRNDFPTSDEAKAMLQSERGQRP
ncbi:MAG TPA: type IV pilus biogenesis/stability protein PilW [Steroidobacteraceae bacterium]|nr:type IV pilus biogenesis/stability protein PilW [Steroidobacteraceae bacterium]